MSQIDKIIEEFQHTIHSTPQAEMFLAIESYIGNLEESKQILSSYNNLKNISKLNEHYATNYIHHFFENIYTVISAIKNKRIKEEMIYNISEIELSLYGVIDKNILLNNEKIQLEKKIEEHKETIKILVDTITRDDTVVENLNLKRMSERTQIETESMVEALLHRVIAEPSLFTDLLPLLYQASQAIESFIADYEAERAVNDMKSDLDFYPEEW